MGFYINPTDQSKQEWLDKNAIAVPAPPKSIAEGDGLVPLVLVQNTFFSAVGIAYSEAELQLFKDPMDFRPKSWYWADKDEVLKVCPEASSVLR